MTTVFDASVVVKVLTRENLSAEAAAALAEESDPIAPQILTIEVASALSKKVRYHDLRQDFAKQRLAALPLLAIRQIDLADLIEDALSLSIELSHALYDCLYLALAEKRDCRLITADEKFTRVIADSSYAHRLKRLSEC